VASYGEHVVLVATDGLRDDVVSGPCVSGGT
jgi:hypothetical protein